MDKPNEAAQRLVTAALSSKKYAALCPATLERMALRTAERYPKYAQALDAYKAALHQLAGSYVTPEALRQARRWLEEAAQGAAFDERALCGRVLALHVSSRERLSVYEGLYRELWSVTGAPERLLDLACGLNPFSFPWMGLKLKAYRAWDVHGETTELCNGLFRLLGLPKLAECRDVLSGVEDGEGDVALCQKLLPLLEHQERGSAARLLRDLKTRWLVASYPLRSLGGREKGMAEHYRTLAEAQIPDCWQRRAERVIGSEWFLICERN